MCDYRGRKYTQPHSVMDTKRAGENPTLDDALDVLFLCALGDAGGTGSGNCHDTLC